MMKKILLFLLLFGTLAASAQFNPNAHVVVNDAIGQQQAAPIEGRGMFWDQINFRWRDYQNTAEVLSTLPTNANRFSHFPIWVHVGGTLSGGVWTGGTSQIWFFKDGLANGNLVRWYTDSVIVPNAVVYVKRLSDTTFYAARADSSRDTVLIRGSGASGSISSLQFTAPSIFNTPVIFTNTAGAWTGALSFSNQSSGTVLAGPISGGPGVMTARSLLVSDLPTGIPNGNLANSSISLSMDNTGTTPGFGTSSVSLGGTLVFHNPFASATTSGPLTSTDWNRFNGAVTAIVTSVNGQVGAVSTRNADSIKNYPVDITNFRNGWVLALDTVNLKYVFQNPASGTGISNLNGLTASSQTFALGTAGTSQSIVSSGGVHTFNTPILNGADTGLATPTMYNLWNGKQSALSGTGYSKWSGTTPTYLTSTQVTADLNLFTTLLQGLVPQSGGGTVNFLRADGTWATPSGGGGTVTGFNNGLSLSGAIGQLGGRLLQNTTVSAANTYKITLDSLIAGFYLHNLKSQTNPTGSYKLLLSDTSDNGQVYTGQLQLFDSTGASGLTTPYLFLNTATNTIQVTSLPVGPWIKAGNITSTQASTDTVDVGTILYPKAKVNIGGGLQVDGAFTGKNTIIMSADSTNADTLQVTYTGAGNYSHKHMITTINGSNPTFSTSANLNLTDWTNANISNGASQIFTQYVYRENAVGGSTRSAIGNFFNTPRIGASDSLGVSWGQIISFFNPSGKLLGLGGIHMSGSGDFPNILGSFGILDDNYTVNSGNSEHAAIKSNVVYGVNNWVVNANGGAHSRFPWLISDSIKIGKPISANGTASLMGIGSTDSLLGKITLGTNLSMSGNTLNATGGGGGSQTLQQTLVLGNIASTNIVDSNTIQGDSGVYRNGYLTGNVQVGDTILTSGQLQTWFIYGSSGSTDPGLNAAIGYGKATATYLRQLTYIDSAISGTGISHNQGAQALANRIAGLPTYNSTTSFLWSVDAGINDAYLTDSVAYKTDLAKIIDTLHLNRGWPLNKILIMSPWYCPTRLVDSNFVQVDRVISATKGVLFLDVWHPFQQGYFSGQALIYSDSLHPSTLGQFYWSRLISNVIKYGEFIGNFTNYGNTRHRRNLTVDSITTISGLLYPNGGIGQKAKDSSINFIAQPSLSNGDYLGLVLAPNPAQVALTDSMEMRMTVNTGAASQYGIYRRSAGSLTPLFYASGTNKIGLGTSTLQSSYGVTTSGGVYAGGASYINGSLTILGDNTNNNLRYPFYNSGGNQFGMGNDASNNTLFSNGFGLTEFGSLSGGVFTGRSAFNIGGSKLFLNTLTDNGNGDILQVNGRIAATAAVLSGDNVYREQYYPFFSGSGNYIGMGLKSTNEMIIGNNFGPISFGAYSGIGTGLFTEHSQFNTAATRLSINTTDDASNALNVNGRGKFTDTLKLPNIARKLFDTTNFKHIVKDASGNLFWMDWNPSSGSGVTTVGTFSGSSQTNGASISTSTITFGPADATNPGMIKNTGSQTLGATLTMPAPLFTSLTSSGANDSVLTVDPSTGQVHRRSGVFNLTFSNGLHPAPTLDSVLLGGTLNQTTTIANAGFGLTISGSGKTNFNAPVLFGQATTTDANYTVGNESQVLLVGITANRTLTLPSASGNTGRVITIANYNTTSFIWTNSLIIDPTGGGIPIGYLVNGATYDVFSDGSGWILRSIHYGSGQQVNQNAVTISSGTASTVANFLTNVFVDPSTLIATYTLTLPSNPPDGALVKIHFGGSIAGNATVVTSLTISPNSGQSIEQTAAPITAVGGNCFIYQYNIAVSKWYREQ